MPIIREYIRVGASAVVPALPDLAATSSATLAATGSALVGPSSLRPSAALPAMDTS